MLYFFQPGIVLTFPINSDWAWDLIFQYHFLITMICFWKSVAVYAFLFLITQPHLYRRKVCFVVIHFQGVVYMLTVQI